MRRNPLLWIAPWIACGLGACVTARPPEASKDCAEWLQIGIRSPSERSCPEIPGWKPPQPLFASLPAQAEAKYEEKQALEDPNVEPDPKVAQELERFCVYEKENQRGQTPVAPTVDSRLVRMDPDCPATLQAVSKDWKTFSNYFLEQAGRPQTANSRGVSGNGTRPDVRLTFLDTHPDHDGVPTAPPQRKIKGTSEHGYTLTQIARNLLCSPEAGDRCVAQITTRLALPIRRFRPGSQRRTLIDTKNGGHIGTQGHLAEAIQREVDDWRKDRDQGGPRHLVLNLSVAWDPKLFGGLDEAQIAEMRAGTQAVYWALRYAADFDVLVLAAAGNAKNCESETVGPLLPAAWEEGTPPDGLPGKPFPLVYAVGGVDSQGVPLPNARRKGMPQRVAYGRYAVVPASTPGDSTRMYTGSSIATAVVSSTAASVWNTLPGDDSVKVVDLLYSSGEELCPRTADFSFGSPSPAPRIHRISLCKALEAACRESGASGCDLSCPPWPAEDSGPDVPWKNRFRRRLSCHPWLLPQPEEDPCPICKPPRG